jgi:hypothetical protein
VGHCGLSDGRQRVVVADGDVIALAQYEAGHPRVVWGRRP